MSVYDMILSLIGDNWTPASTMLDKLEDRGLVPHKGTVSRAYSRAMKRDLIERRKSCGGMRWQYEYRTKREEHLR